MNSINHVPLEVCQTFVKIVENDFDATAAAQELGISQPSISKRLSALRRIEGDRDDCRWLILKGKHWLLTPAERVRGVVADLVRKYKQVEQFSADTGTARSTLSAACGQTAATGFVRTAVERFVVTHSEVQIRESTARRRWRIERVAANLT